MSGSAVVSGCGGLGGNLGGKFVVTSHTSIGTVVWISVTLCINGTPACCSSSESSPDDFAPEVFTVSKFIDCFVSRGTSCSTRSMSIMLASSSSARLNSRIGLFPVD